MIFLNRLKNNNNYTEDINQSACPIFTGLRTPNPDN